ncbi:MAG: exopolysaccharide biosynthesis polyprenyl glycosylphosphotransferase [Prevotella sp.]|nr:exopolysaccharide biosynthesis polyprenyl glycosylphosphotransferase [Prevotella sp.]
MREYSSGNDIIRVIVILGDFVLLSILIMAFYYLLPQDMLPVYFKYFIKEVLLVSNFSMLIAQYFFHTIIHFRKIRLNVIFLRVLKLTFAQAIIMFVALRIISDGGGLFQFMLIFIPALYATLLIARLTERNILKFYRKRGGNTRCVVFVGSDPANLMLYKDLIAEPTTGYIVKGYFSNDVIEDCPDEFVKLGSIDDLNKIIESDNHNILVKKVHQKDDSFRLDLIDEFFCCLSHDESEEIIRIMRFCDNNIIHFHYVPRMYGNFRLHLKPERFGDMSLYTNLREPLTYMSNKIVKRLFDIVFSLIACILLLPFIPIIGFIILCQSRGPIFFKQERTGLNGKTFLCYKFRSMHVNSDANTKQATKDDPRKFAFGEFMRKTNIDELPQFFNVLVGDMSVVGPRPHMVYHTEHYRKLIDKYMVRHFSRPGITGWAQVTGFRGETKELWQMEERIRRDIWYIENWSFWLDLKIILMTFTSFFKHDKNAY